MRRQTVTITHLASCASRRKQLRHVYHTGYTHTHSHCTLRAHIMIFSQLLCMRMPTQRATQRTCRGLSLSRRRGSCDLTSIISNTNTQALDHTLSHHTPIDSSHHTAHTHPTSRHTCIHTSCIIRHSDYTSSHPDGECVHAHYLSD